MIATRVAQLTDVEEIARLTAQLGYDVPADVVRARLASILERADHRFVVAEVDGCVAAWIHGAVIECIEAEPFVMIAGLVVDREHRKAGVGRLLLGRIEAWARERDCSIVRLWSSASRAGAHRFYETVGYTKIKTQYSFAKSLEPGGERVFREFLPRIDDEHGA
jgi:GNAT superfamily N-acetyltransferase